MFNFSIPRIFRVFQMAHLITFGRNIDLPWSKNHSLGNYQLIWGAGGSKCSLGNYPKFMGGSKYRADAELQPPNVQDGEDFTAALN